MYTEQITTADTQVRLDWARAAGKAYALTKSEQAVLNEVAKLADHFSGICWPAQQEMAQGLDLHRATVMRCFTALAKLDLLTLGTRKQRYRYYHVQGAPAWIFTETAEAIDAYRAKCDITTREMRHHDARNATSQPESPDQPDQQDVLQAQMPGILPPTQPNRDVAFRAGLSPSPTTTTVNSNSSKRSSELSSKGIPLNSGAELLEHVGIEKLEIWRTEIPGMEEFEDPELLFQAGKCVDYWVGKQSGSKNWLLTFRNWMVKEIEWQQSRNRRQDAGGKEIEVQSPAIETIALETPADLVELLGDTLRIEIAGSLERKDLGITEEAGRFLSHAMNRGMERPRAAWVAQFRTWVTRARAKSQDDAASPGYERVTADTWVEKHGRPWRDGSSVEEQDQLPGYEKPEPVCAETLQCHDIAQEAWALDIWEKALRSLELQVSRPIFRTWLKDTHGWKRLDTVVLVTTPTVFVAEWLDKRMSGLVDTALSQAAGERLTAHFTAQESSSNCPIHEQHRP